MAHMRRLKRTKVLNPAALMGVLDSGVEPDKLLALFGTDPVHLTEIGYKDRHCSGGRVGHPPRRARQESDGWYTGSRLEHSRTEATSKGELDCRY